MQRLAYGVRTGGLVALPRAALAGPCCVAVVLAMSGPAAYVVRSTSGACMCRHRLPCLKHHSPWV